MNYKLILFVAIAVLVITPITYYSGVTANLAHALGASPKYETVADDETIADDDSEVLTGTRLLRQAAHRLRNFQPLQASVRHKIEIFGQQLTGPGRYVQAGNGSNKARLDLTFQSGDFKSELTQINDGRFLYIRNDSDSATPMQRIDLARLGENAEKKEPRRHSMDSSSWMAMGGLAYLVGQLEKDFEFEKPLNSELGGIDVFVMEGTWKPERISAICKNLMVVDENGKILYEKLPQHMPSHVRVALGKNVPLGLFPHQIVYFRKQNIENSHSRLKPIATFEFHDVKPATELSTTTFQIKEDNTRLTDITNSVFEQPLQGNRIR